MGCGRVLGGDDSLGWCVRVAYVALDGGGDRMSLGEGKKAGAGRGRVSSVDLVSDTRILHGGTKSDYWEKEGSQVEESCSRSARRHETRSC